MEPSTILLVFVLNQASSLIIKFFNKRVKAIVESVFSRSFSVSTKSQKEVFLEFLGEVSFSDPMVLVVENLPLLVLITGILIILKGLYSNHSNSRFDEHYGVYAPLHLMIDSKKPYYQRVFRIQYIFPTLFLKQDLISNLVKQNTKFTEVDLFEDFFWYRQNIENFWQILARFTAALLYFIISYPFSHLTVKIIVFPILKNKLVCFLIATSLGGGVIRVLVPITVDVLSEVAHLFAVPIYKIINESIDAIKLDFKLPKPCKNFYTKDKQNIQLKRLDLKLVKPAKNFYTKDKK